MPQGRLATTLPLGGIKSWREILLPPTLHLARSPPVDSCNLVGHFPAMARLRHSHIVNIGSLRPGLEFSYIQEQL
ncbi:hypothetical protein E2C01_049090 [Portunus trituberculatus]|uniref:Uncharacterized protein n=1 Tax=Portunus trituberculatus TaxID=210409 RepID=A0A5B7G4R1_PORTR|nr:hypothetical protein [Portunus trituberculatus]